MYIRDVTQYIRGVSEMETIPSSCYCHSVAFSTFSVSGLLVLSFVYGSWSRERRRVSVYIWVVPVKSGNFWRNTITGHFDRFQNTGKYTRFRCYGVLSKEAAPWVYKWALVQFQYFFCARWLCLPSFLFFWTTATWPVAAFVPALELKGMIITSH
jgi:hypothetical protein